MAQKTIPRMFGPTGAFHSCLRTPLEGLSLTLPGSTTGFIKSQETSVAVTHQSQPNHSQPSSCTGTPMNSDSTTQLSTSSTAPSTPWKCKFSQKTFSIMAFSAQLT